MGHKSIFLVVLGVGRPLLYAVKMCIGVQLLLEEVRASLTLVAMEVPVLY